MEHWLGIILAALFFGLIAGDTISPVREEVSGREGQSVTLTCNYQTDEDYIWLYWYKHHSDLQAPQFILWKGAKSRSNQKYIPDERYGSETSATSTTLTIRDLTLADTALYYCALEISVPRGGGILGSALIFGKPIRLTIQPKETADSKPKLFILSPLHPEGKPLSEMADDVCLATNIKNKDDQMDLNVKDGKVSMNTTSATVSPKDDAYVYAGFTNQTIYSCELNGTSSNNDNVGLCADLHPEKAKPNFYLLIMNGLRVLFTKSLAFSTILTIRAALT